MSVHAVVLYSLAKLAWRLYNYLQIMMVAREHPTPK